MTTASSIPKTRFGIVLVFVYFVLIFLSAVQNPSNFQASPFYWMGVLAIFGAVIYYLVSVFKLHCALVAGTNGQYIVSPRRAVGLHFAPFFNLYWAFKWPSEVARFIAAATPERKIAAHWLPGALILLGFFVGQVFDGGLSVLVNFAVLGWLIRRAKAGLEKGEVAAQAYASENIERTLNMKAIWIAVGVGIFLMIVFTVVNLAALPPVVAPGAPVAATAVPAAPAAT